MPQPNALYTLSIGADDLFAAISAFPSTPFKALSDIGAAVVNVDKFVLQLAAHGGKNFVVLSVPDIGKAPALREPSAISAVFDAALTTSLQAIAATDHLNLDIVDTYSLVDQAVAHPALFGFTNVTRPVWTGNYRPKQWNLACHHAGCPEPISVLGPNSSNRCGTYGPRRVAETSLLRVAWRSSAASY